MKNTIFRYDEDNIVLEIENDCATIFIRSRHKVIIYVLYYKIYITRYLFT